MHESRASRFKSNLTPRPWLGLADQRLTLGADGTWNFKLQADGIDRRDSGPHADKLQRFNEYQAALRFGYEWRERWGVRLISLLKGPMYYDTEERLLGTAEPARNFVHRKDAYWVFNLRSHYNVIDRITVYGGIDNLLDKNEHPIFIALDGAALHLRPLGLQRRPGQLDARGASSSPA